MKRRIYECLNNQTGSHLLPFLWYTGESAELVCRELETLQQIGIKEVTLENRGGDWFCTEPWFQMLETALLTARKLGMRIWLLDDDHVPTGSANNSLAKPGNAHLRPRNLRIEPADVVGPLPGAALLFPAISEAEKIVSVSAFRREEVTGHCYGVPVNLTENLQDGICNFDIPDGIWRVFFVIEADIKRLNYFGNFISMLSKESCRHLIDEVQEKIYARLGQYFGKELAGFFTDEPAFGNCNGEYGHDFQNHRMGQLERLYPWWEGIAAKVAAKANMSEAELLPRLPALWDEVDCSSAKLRLAYMDTITALWRENFSCQLGNWCREHHVEYIGHVLEDEGTHQRTGFGCGHFFRAMQGMDMAGLDVVLNQIVPGITSIRHTSNSAGRQFNYKFYQYTLARLGASLAHISPHMKNRVMCEIMGAYGWTAGVSIIRALFNHFLAAGTTHFVPHAFSLIIPDGFPQHAERTDCNLANTPPGYAKGYLPPTFHARGCNPQFEIFAKIVAYVQRIAHLISSGIHRADLAVCYNAEAEWMGGKSMIIDDVAATLSRAGFDFDFLPIETICNDSSTQGKRLCVNQETYGALVIPQSERLPEAFLKRIDELLAQGVPVIFVDSLPAASENATRISCHANCTQLDLLPALLQDTCGKRVHFSHWEPDLHFYCQDDLCVFSNESRNLVDSTVTCPGWESCRLYDPWENQIYLPEFTAGGFRLQIAPRQLLIALFHSDLQAGPFDYAQPELHPLPLRYDISIRNVGDDDFVLLRQDSEPVNLNLEENLTRCCARFRYDAIIPNGDASWTRLNIPGAGDCATLFLNGVCCGTQLGPQATFKINGKINNGPNTIRIETADNPSYIDRKTPYGRRLPLQPHGFIGPIQTG